MKQLSCEVLVAGGGVAGVCAALAAARSGVRTILAERHNTIGGTGYAGMLQHICGLYLNGDALPRETLNEGLTREIAGLLSDGSPESSARRIGQVYVLPYSPHHLLSILDVLVNSEQNMTVMRNTLVTAVDCVCNRIRTVSVVSEHGMQAIRAAVVIDATGNGDVAVMAGAGYELAPEHDRQLAGFSVRVSGLLTDDTLAIKVPYCCARAVAQDQLPPLARFTAFSPGEVPGEGTIKMSLHGDDCEARNERARAMAQTLLDMLRQNLPAFQDAVITGMSLGVMEREGRRIIGDYTLTGDDVRSARKFPDAIVKNAWPMELWDRTNGPRYQYVPRGEYYEIPIGCIRVAGVMNLLTAGRCISVSHEALGSTRVMGTCMALGDQAGRVSAHTIMTSKITGSQNE